MRSFCTCSRITTTKIWTIAQLLFCCRRSFMLRSTIILAFKCTTTFRTRQARLSRHLPFKLRNRRFLPLSKVRVDTSTGSREQADQRNRHWQSINHPTCYGRFVADTEDENLRDGSYRLSKRDQTHGQCMDVIRYHQSGGNRSEHAAQ